MPYHRMFKGGFEPDQLQTMGVAFEEALAAMWIVNRNGADADSIAKAIIELAADDVTDVNQLRDHAIKTLTQATAASKLADEKILNDPDHWRRRAMEARGVADRLSDAESKRHMLNVADSYDRVAERAEITANRPSQHIGLPR